MFSGCIEIEYCSEMDLFGQNIFTNFIYEKSEKTLSAHFKLHFTLKKLFQKDIY